MNALFKSLTVILPLLGLMSVTACGLQISILPPETVRFIHHISVRVERDITYSTVDGVCLKMDIYYPLEGGRPIPVVVYIHGGGWYSGDKTTGAGQCDISTLTARGYLVAAIDYRLAPRHKFPAQIEDVKCAIRFLRANAATYGIDPSHIGAMGDSAGGHLASLLGVTGTNAVFEDSGWYADQSSQVQAVVNMFGPADLTVNFQRDKSLLIEHVFGTSDENSPIIRQASPVTHVSADDPPFLILHGDRDDEICPCQSDILYQRLLSAGIPVTLMMVRNSGHSFTPVGGAISPTRAEITETIVDFFDQYLK